jgi:hypothetical protein
MTIPAEVVASFLNAYAYLPNNDIFDYLESRSWHNLDDLISETRKLVDPDEIDMFDWHIGNINTDTRFFIWLKSSLN